MRVFDRRNTPQLFPHACSINLRVYDLRTPVGRDRERQFRAPVEGSAVQTGIIEMRFQQHAEMRLSRAASEIIQMSRRLSFWPELFFYSSEQ